MKTKIAILCAIFLAPGDVPFFASQAQESKPQQSQIHIQQTGNSAPAQESVKIPDEQLDALVAPIALYPDPLLSQTLVASTYPLEIVQLQQWLQKNPNLKDQALVSAVEKQPWDPSIQAMAALPEVVKRLADDIQWTTELGNAVLAQQADVMKAVQRMRQKAQGEGALKSTEQQKVETKVVENQSVIVIEQADPQVVYVPEYNPVAVYGPAVYPYPSIYYPPYTAGGVIAASAISFGVGVAMGAAWGGGWGWGAGWGGNDIDVNFDNSFNRSANVNRDISGSRTWQHNPQHRGGAPYADRATASRYGSNARGDSLASRSRGAQQQIARQGGNLGSIDRGGLGSGGGARAQSFGAAGGANSIGSRNIGSSAGNRGLSAGTRGLSAGSSGFSGSSARASSMRGSSSLGRSGGGGFRGGGGGGFRGGGGRRR